MQFLNNYLTTLQTNWTDFSKEKNSVLKFGINIVFCIFSISFLIDWLGQNSFREGFSFIDPIQQYLSPRDFSGYIFFFMYFSTLLIIIDALPNPKHLHFCIQAYTAIFIIRCLCIYCIPLSPAHGIIVLSDPLTKVIAHEDHILNDLFFSGHVSSLFLFFLAAKNKYIKYYMLVTVPLVALLLVCQRVHYTLDVFCAPFFAYCAYDLFVNKQILKGSE